MKMENKFRKILIWYLFGLMFFFAISSTMLGIVVEEIAADYHLSYAGIGLIGSIQGIGGLIANISGGIFSDRFPKKRLIGISFAGFTAVLCLMGLIPPYMLLLVYFLMIGIFSGYLNLLISAYLPELAGENVEFYMNISHAFYGLGSLTGPLYSLIVMKSGFRWNQVFLMLGVICVLIFTVYLRIAGKAGDGGGQVRQKENKAALREVLLDRRILVISLLTLLYMGQQSVVNLWIVSYLQEYLGSGIGGIALSLYWTGVMAGRFLVSFVCRKIDSKKWICVGCLIAAVLWIIVLPLHNAGAMVVCLCVNGVLTGAAFPICISAACLYRPWQTGMATSIVCLASSIGGSILTGLAGVLVENFNHTVGLSMVPAVLLACAALTGWLLRSENGYRR